MNQTERFCEFIFLPKKPGRGARKKLFGALALPTREERRRVYRGRVGSGLTDADLEAIMVQLQGQEIERPPFPEPGGSGG